MWQELLTVIKVLSLFKSHTKQRINSKPNTNPSPNVILTKWFVLRLNTMSGFNVMIEIEQGTYQLHFSA